MIQRGHFAFSNARMQARHGMRPTTETWVLLESSGDLAAYLAQAARTSLNRWTHHLSYDMSAQAIERALRSGWRAYVLEVARWVPGAWRDAVACCTWLADLPALEYLLGAQPDLPGWLLEDGVTAEFAAIEREERDERLGQSLPAQPGRRGRPVGPTARWAGHWRSLWPRTGGRETRGLDALQHLVAEHLGRMAEADGPERGQQHRDELGAGLVRIFRRHSRSPAAAFAHLGVIALDLERLRGGLLTRALFTREPMVQP